ncbi:MAG: carbon-nitrogen hydrolase family protein [Acidimicrobiia bacterium]|nr:carbon-nitrogen hydrolase family protein [Acidimicrobiia bacterium]
MSADIPTGKVTVAAIQAAPVFLDRDATVEKACRLIGEAAERGARIMVFPETFIPGYPFWPRDNSGPARVPILKAFVRYFRNSVAIPSPQTDAMCAAAKRANAYVVMGLSELDSEYGGSLYNTMLFIGPDGRILGKHRKLVPTYGERCIWGMGDGSTMQVFPTEYGKLGGLVCYEHHMVLTRYALMAMGERIHAAVWPAHRYLKNIVDAACRQYAFEGQVFVITASSYMNADMVPDWFELKDASYWDAAGGSGIIGPLGNYLAGPTYDKEEILVAELDFEQIIQAKSIVDSVGHYSRWDVLSLNLNTTKYAPIHPRPAARANGGTAEGPGVDDLGVLARLIKDEDLETRELVARLIDRIERRAHAVESPRPSALVTVESLGNHQSEERRLSKKQVGRAKK